MDNEKKEQIEVNVHGKWKAWLAEALIVAALTTVLSVLGAEPIKAIVVAAACWSCLSISLALLTAAVALAAFAARDTK